MNLIKLTLTTFLMTSLIACGGGSPDKDSANSSADADTNQEAGEGGTTTTEDGTTTSTNTTVGTPDIGNGTGSNYTDGAISVASGGLVGGQLAAGGQVSISVDVVDVAASNSRISGTEYGVVFSSTCAGAVPARSTIDGAESVTNSGTITTTYRAEGCSGQDLVTATLYNSSGGEIDKTNPLAIASAVIDIVPPTVNNIAFVSVTEKSLGIKSVGNPNLQQVSTITFIVNDINGDPIANQEVNFSIDASSDSATLAKTSEITDASGQVSVVLNSGSRHGSVRVKALAEFMHEGVLKKVITYSSPISISTGYPVQSKMTIAAKIFNPLSISTVGTTSAITVYATDRFGNPPPDGTIVNFSTEGGSIEPSCETTGGACSVEWRSQNSIPGDNSADSINVNDIVGFSTILAYTLGDSDYSDANNNGVFDDGEAFVSYSEPFRDDNWSATQEASELYIDTDNNGAHSAADSSLYQGTLCSDGAVALGHCATNMHISQSLRLVMSGEASVLRVFTFDGAVYSEVDFGAGDQIDITKSHYVVLQDANGNIPANGTSVSFSAEGLEITSDTGDVENSTGFISIAGLPDRGATYSISFKDEDSADNPNIPVLKIQVSRIEASDLSYELPLSSVTPPPP